jgi:hypothetical protein
MKTRNAAPQPPTRPKAIGAPGFTLTELQIVMGLVLLVISGIITAYLYGLRMFEFVKPKLCASDDARQTVGRLTEEIRSAYLIRVGTGSANSFVEASVGSPQAGSAIQIYPSQDTNIFIRYFWDASDRALKRLDSQSGRVTLMAQSVSNEVVFTSEDFAGNVLSNNYNNRVIGVTLQFYQIQFPTMPIGPGNFYDFYQLKSKITRRILF